MTRQLYKPLPRIIVAGTASPPETPRVSAMLTHARLSNSATSPNVAKETSPNRIPSERFSSGKLRKKCGGRFANRVAEV